MDDMTLTAEMPENNSTVIDTDIQGTKSGGGKPAVEPTPEKEAPRKPESARDSLEAEAKKIAAQEDKGDDDGDEKPVVNKEADEKAKSKSEEQAKSEEVKESARKADESERAEKTKRELRSESLREPPPAPARLLPSAQEKWKHVPQEVKFEVTRLLQEAETNNQQYVESHKFREELKEFEDLARQSGTTIKEAMTNYVTMEKALRADPSAGFRQLLNNMQINPQQAISHILSAYNVTPQALARHIDQNPNEYTALAAPKSQPQVQQPQSQSNQSSPEIAQLREELNALRAERVAESIITPFRAQYPEYDQYEGQIAKVLNSGIIDEIHGSGIGPHEKLEAALFMVSPEARSRAFASNNNSSPNGQVSSHDNAPVDDLRGGNKSVKSSLGDVEDYTAVPQKKEDMRDMLYDLANKIGRRA